MTKGKKITVTGTKEFWTGTKGNDTINVKGSKSYNIDAKGGNDTITVYKGNEHYITTGNNGTNKVIIKSGNGHTVIGGYDTNAKGSDVITINKGKHHWINGGFRKKTTVNLKGGNVDAIITWQGNDVITISGKATVSNKAWQYTRTEKCGIDTGSGKDKVTFEASAGSGAIVYTGAGNDTITIKGGNKQQIHTGAGTDTIKVSGGTGHKIYLDEGTNKLTLSNSKATIFTGYAATDKITINWKKGKTNNYTIDTPQTISNATVKLDTLRISGIKSDAFKFAENNNGALVMSTGDGRITISNFDEAWKWDYFGLSFANGITFDDKTLSLDEISKKISIV